MPASQAGRRGFDPRLPLQCGSFVALSRHIYGNQDNSAGFDAEALWKRVDGDPELLRGLIAVFETEYPGMLAGATRAIEDQDPAQLEKAAHKIKGTMLQFSAGTAAANTAVSKGPGPGHYRIDLGGYHGPELPSKPITLRFMR